MLLSYGQVVQAEQAFGVRPRAHRLAAGAPGQVLKLGNRIFVGILSMDGFILSEGESFSTRRTPIKAVSETHQVNSLSHRRGGPQLRYLVK